MIQDVDETLGRLLTAELSKVPGCPVRDREQVTFDLPSVVEAIQDGEARVNLYLHDVRENVERRDESFRVLRKSDEKGAGIRRAPVTLDLSYLVTAHAGSEPAAEHRLLSDALGVLLRCRSVPAGHLAGALEGRGSNAVELAVAQPDHLASVDPPALWGALGGQMRPALALLVTAPFDPFETKWTKVVREAIFGMGQGVPPDGPRRPLDTVDVRVSAAGVVVDQETEIPLTGAVITVVGWREAATTDAQGFFSLLNLSPGAQNLRIRKKGYRSQEANTIAPPPGHPEQLEPMVIALRPLDAAERALEEAASAAAARDAGTPSEVGRVSRVSLAGRLQKEDGSAAAYVPVRVGSRSTTTDRDGVYYFFDLPDGEHTVIVDVPGQTPIELSAGKGKGPDVRTTILPAAAIRADTS